MELKHLRYFIEVVNHESFTQAAEKLLVTQPMLTRAVKQIEEELDVKLIERTSKYFRVTDAGKMFYQQSLDLLLRFNDLHRNIDDVKSSNIGEVRFSTPGVLLDAFFPPLLKKFYQQYPNITISIVEEGSKLTAQSVLADQADLGLVMMPVANLSHMQTDIVISSVCQVLISKDHPFAHRTAVPLRDLRDERIITFSETATLHDTFISMCEHSGFSPNIVYKSLMMDFIFDMVDDSFGVAVLPLPLIHRKLTDHFITLPLNPVIPWDIAVATKKDRYQSFAARTLLSFVKEYFQEIKY